MRTRTSKSTFIILFAGMMAAHAFGPGVGRAQQQGEGRGDVPEPRGSPDGLQREAQTLFKAGRIAFEEGRFQSAYDSFKRAHKLSGKPGLLYNLGVAADRLRKDRLALEHFREYLKKVPDAPNRSQVESRIEVLERVVARQGGGGGSGSGSKSDSPGSQQDAESGDSGDDTQPGPAPEGYEEASEEQSDSGESDTGAAEGDVPPPPDPAGKQGGSAPPTPSHSPEPSASEQQAQAQQPRQTRTGAEQAKDVRLFFAAYAGAGGTANISVDVGTAGGSTDRDMIPSGGFELRIGFPFAKYVGMGIMIRPAALWNTERADDQGYARSYFFDIGPYVWGGYPITVGSGYIMPFAALQVGGTASALTGTTTLDSLPEVEQVGGGWTISAMVGAEFLIGSTFAVFVDTGFVQHDVEHGSVNIITREALINGGVGFVF